MAIKVTRAHVRISPDDDLLKLSSHNKDIISYYEFKTLCDDLLVVYGNSGSKRFLDYIPRLKKCSSFLIIDACDIYAMNYCRVPWCPICQWRRSMKWRAKFFELLPSLLQEYPNARFLFLTLTVPNCPVQDLSVKISDMNKAWQRFIQRKTFRNVLGWVRTLEITKEGVKEGFSDRKHYAHPHFHCLLMVSSTYFNHKYYVTQADWQAAWSESMRDLSISSVHIKAVKADSHEALMKQICETLKYSVKVGNVLGDDDWFLTMAEQTYRKRLIASGGVIKGFLRSSADEDDLIDSSPVSVHSGAVYVYGHHEDFCVPYYKKSKPSDF